MCFILFLIEINDFSENQQNILLRDDCKHFISVAFYTGRLKTRKIKRDSHIFGHFLTKTSKFKKFISFFPLGQP